MKASSIASCGLGNILEWYDFGLFTIFSPLFSKLFFPNDSAGMIATFGIFAAGFLCRPLGALIFGYLGDTVGRAKTLRLSVLMISMPTLLIGILPTYQAVGIWAPISLVIIRMWQGISIGGEYSGNLVYLAESAPSKFRATLTSLAGTGANAGVLLAALVGTATSTLLSTKMLHTFGWRLPYFFSGLLCLFIYYFRFDIEETDVFNQIKAAATNKINPITYIFKHNFPELMRTLGLVCMGSTFYYFCFIFLPVCLSQSLHYSIKATSTIFSFFVASMILFVPIGGYICDRVGRRKMLIFNASLITLAVVPGMYLMQLHTTLVFMLVLIIFTIASSLEQGTTSISVVENFPPRARYTGLSLGYNLGNGFLGGTVPMICQWLVHYTHSVVTPAIYIACCAAITGLVAYFFVPETSGCDLAQIEPSLRTMT